LWTALRENEPINPMLINSQQEKLGYLILRKINNDLMQPTSWMTGRNSVAGWHRTSSACEDKIKQPPNHQTGKGATT
jgi:hypothetical protein